MFEAQPQSLDRVAVPLGGRKGDRALDRVLERRDTDGPGGQLDFAIDEDCARERAHRRRVAVLPVDGPLADAEAEVGAGGRRHADLAGPHRVLEPALHRRERQ